MRGEKNLATLLKTMQPVLNEGDYVFCAVASTESIDQRQILGSFREKEACTVIIKKEFADSLQFPYTFVAAWITLTVHSSLNAVGLTAAFAGALSKENISCNVVAGYYHDHIFVKKEDAALAMQTLHRLSAGE